MTPTRARDLAPGVFSTPLAVALALIFTIALSGCLPGGESGGRDDNGDAGNNSGESSGAVILVPSEAPTLTEAEARAKPGDTILIAPGTYEEQLLITTPDITVRGEDRNDTVIDGGGMRPFGVVAMADGVRVENLTVANATFYGLLFTGLHDETGPSAPTANDYQPWNPAEFPPLQRFLADHVTAVNNGLYGIYAFNAQHGEIRDSYASGSADSGFYVGQCVECDILLTGNVAERNAVGFENSNASDSVVVAGNRFTGNRIGMTLLSSYQEAFLPQKGNVIVGNLIGDSAAEHTPAQASGGFGTGIGISGGVGNLIVRNSIGDNVRAGILLNNAEDLPSFGNAFVENVFAGNRIDVANTSADRAGASANCVSGPGAGSVEEPVAGSSLATLPESLFAELSNGGSCEPLLDEGTEQSAAAEIGGPETPPGISFRKVAWPLAQPNLQRAASGTLSHEMLPDRVTMPDITGFEPPASDFLADRAGVR